MTSPSLFDPFTLPCGVVLKNRIVKSAMSDSLGDGRGDPTAEQVQMYNLWAEGGLAAAIIGEVQGDPKAAEKPGNLVLHAGSDLSKMRTLASAGQVNGAMLWVQLGHAGAMTHPATGIPKGPSAIDLPLLSCDALSAEEIASLPAQFASTAATAKDFGFGGVQIHAAHGFLLSQFLSPLFNNRDDAYGGSITGRMRLLLETIAAVREAVGPAFPIAVKLNSSDQLEGGLVEEEALIVVQALDATSVDLIDISGGTYFPGAASASDRAGSGPYFLDFAAYARAKTTCPLMVTGGFKTRDQVEHAINSGAADIVGLARALILEPSLPSSWHSGSRRSPDYPRFKNPPEGGVTAWYTMAISRLAKGEPAPSPDDLATIITEYETRDADRTEIWNQTF